MSLCPATMDDAKLQALHDSLSKLRGGSHGLGTSSQYSWQRRRGGGESTAERQKRLGLPNNTLYSYFVPEGAYKRDSSNPDDGDGRFIKKDFSDLQEETNDNASSDSSSSHDDQEKRRRRKEKRKAAKKVAAKAAKLAAKKKEKLEEKKRLRKEAKKLKRSASAVSETSEKVSKLPRPLNSSDCECEPLVGREKKKAGKTSAIGDSAERSKIEVNTVKAEKAKKRKKKTIGVSDSVDSSVKKRRKKSETRKKAEQVAGESSASVEAPGRRTKKKKKQKSKKE